MGQKYLKTRNTPKITIFLIWSIAVFMVIYNGPDNFWENIRLCIINLKTKDSLFFFGTPIILTIVNGLISPSVKAILVFWHIRNALPGCRVFSSLIQSDPRIDVLALQSKLGSLPILPREQNTKWFQLYEEVKDTLIVKESHKAFLLSRDITGITTLFLIFGIISFFCAGKELHVILLYAGITFVEFLIFSIVARNHGNRFVCNVIVEYLKSQ
jgi:hypothetical protein